MSEIKKVVLAYSGGLDTSVIIPWLKEHYDNCEVIAVCGNVGQDDELDDLKQRAVASGASKLYVEDLTDEFVNEFVFLLCRRELIMKGIYWEPALPALFWLSVSWKLQRQRGRMLFATAAPERATIRCDLSWPLCTLRRK